jgi:hypothetical protein
MKSKIKFPAPLFSQENHMNQNICLEFIFSFLCVDRRGGFYVSRWKCTNYFLKQGSKLIVS